MASENKIRPATGPAVWRGADYESDTRWIFRLDESALAELDAAVRNLPRGDTDLQKIDRDVFPLPELGPRLAELQREIVEGRGFALIKGIPLDRYDAFEAAALYWGIGLHFGAPVSQNAAGHLLGHVKDAGFAPGDPRRRGYQTPEALRHHTDSCDIVGLMCLRGAKAGGLSSIASAGAVHNAMLEARPDLLEALYRPFHISRIGEVPAGKQRSYTIPIFNRFGGCLTSIYPARDLRMAQHEPGVPPLTAAQQEALALLDHFAEAFSLKMDIAPGDIQFLHNHTILHGRTEFEDFPEPERRRHMLRLWLSAPNGRPLPPAFAERYGTVEQGAVRGGILCPGTELSTPLDLA